MIKIPIRWGNFIFTAAFIGGLTAFFLIFMDPLLKRALIAAGQKAAGARVEIADLNTQIFQGRITLRGVAVADKESPMTNLVEFKKASFQLLPAPLLEKKFVIEESSITGLTWGTPRKTSGALPPPRRKKPQEQSLMARKLAQAVTTAQDFGLSRVETAKKEGQSRADAVKPENLSSLKVLERGEQRAGELENVWKKKIEEQEARLKALSEEVKKDIEALKTEGGGGLFIAERAKKVKEIQAKIKAGQKQLDETRAAAREDIAEVKRIAQEAKTAKEKDLESLRAALGLPSLDQDSIAKMLLGDPMERKLSRILSLFETAKKYMPVKSKEMPRVRDQDRGIFVLFPKENVYPAFLWKKALITGTAPLVPASLEFRGEFGDLAILPGQWREPFTARAQGRQGQLALDLKVLADHRRDAFQDRLELNVAGLSVAGMELGKGKELGALLKDGVSTVRLEIRRLNDLWEGKINADVASAVLEPRLNVKGTLGNRLEQALSSIHEFGFQISFQGRPESLDFSMRSDLGKKISETLKAMLSAEIGAQRKALEDKVNALYSAKAARLDGILNEQGAEILKPLEKQEGALKKLLEDALGAEKSSGEKPADQPVNKLKNIFKK